MRRTPGFPRGRLVLKVKYMPEVVQRRTGCPKPMNPTKLVNLTKPSTLNPKQWLRGTSLHCLDRACSEFLASG